MLRDFGCFLWAVWREWMVLLTGGAIIAALEIWGRAGGRAVPQNINWLILGVTLILAAFFSWRREWIAGGRGFIEFDPNSIKSFFRDRTEVQAQALIRPNIGKHVKLKVMISDVFNAGLFQARVASSYSPNVSVYMNFFSLDAASLLQLPGGVQITVSGRITAIGYFVNLASVSLTDCTLLKIDPAAMPQSTPQSSTHDS